MSNCVVCGRYSAEIETSSTCDECSPKCMYCGVLVEDRQAYCSKGCEEADEFFRYSDEIPPATEDENA